MAGLKQNPGYEDDQDMLMILFVVMCGIVALSCAVIAGTMAIKGQDQASWMPFLIGAGISLFMAALSLSELNGH
jgi:amino acid transporter